MIKDIINELKTTLNIETDKKKITPIDSIKITKDLLKSNSNIINTFKKYHPHLKEDKKFKHMYDIITNKIYIEQIILSNNHYNNLLLSIYFIISNPYIFHLEIFEILYQNRKYIKQIIHIVKKSWNYILNTNLKNFFNKILIDKWLKTSKFLKLTREEVLKNEKNTEEIYNKYCEIYYIFHKTNKKIIKIILKLQKLINTNQNPGSYNLDKIYYITLQKSYSGLTLDYNKLIKLMKFAKKELDALVNEMRNILKKIYPITENMKINEIIKFLQDSKEFKYKSVEEYINHHKSIMNSMEKFFIEDKKIKQYVKPNITVLNNPDLGGAYWAYDTFYLNTSQWSKTNKFKAKALTLHEGIPGHHTQVSYEIHSDTNYYDILYEWFGTTSGFHEGWALFTENLSPDYTELERVGKIQYEMLRTIRIIVDISIHGAGININEIKTFMKKYLSLPDEIIESEIYRYIVLPGQALGYKIGETIIKSIHKKVVKSNNYLSNDSINLYKKLIYSGSLPLDLLLDEYSLSFDDVFSL
jgi:hypothetical protein